MIDLRYWPTPHGDRIAGVAVDLFEPLPPDHPLWKLRTSSRHLTSDTSRKIDRTFHGDAAANSRNGSRPMLRPHRNLDE